MALDPKILRVLDQTDLKEIEAADNISTEVQRAVCSVCTTYYQQQIKRHGIPKDLAMLAVYMGLIAASSDFLERIAAPEVGDEVAERRSKLLFEAGKKLAAASLMDGFVKEAQRLAREAN